MPPKKNKPEKAQVARKQQQVADKTFGLKNKNKSSKVQKYVQQVESQGISGIQKKKEAEQARRLAERRAADKAKIEASELFNPVMQTQKVPFGVDPKTVLCIFFKQGKCTKGAKCKFSHNLDVDRKTQKKDLYTDGRESTKDDMSTWDEEKLRSVVLSKHGNPRTTTSIVCKYFIEAVESKKYGWFWTCPNGGDSCPYKHALPPGFTIKTNEQKQAERAAAANKPTITLEDFLEVERHRLGTNLTPVTLESFTKWKAERMSKKAAEEEIQKKKEAAGVHSGKWLFDHGKFDSHIQAGSDDEDDDSEGDAWNMDELRRRADSVDGRSDDGENHPDYIYEDDVDTKDTS
ncbi:uncharacterized protein V1516DRAFT_619524 [Lipomyces oligophaga]|uniref:uncharacterized protein n=1 Tax=Lipomyces oligophaga TaxID=45792 RepID=UPI0034CDBEE4